MPEGAADTVATYCKSRYQKIRDVGHGAQASVVLVHDVIANEDVVIKRVHLSGDGAEIAKAAREVEILQALKEHPNVVKYLHSFDEYEGVGGETRVLNIVMEYCSRGDLAQFIKERSDGRPKYLEAGHISRWTLQLLQGVGYLHEHGYLHRDLKAANVFITESDDVKIADFGISRCLGRSEAALTMVGTPYYMAPEVMNCDSNGYNSKSDVWSLGVILYQICALRLPFPGNNILAVATAVLENSPTELPQHIPLRIRGMVHRMLTSNPEKRPCLQQLLEEMTSRASPQRQQRGPRSAPAPAVKPKDDETAAERQRRVASPRYRGPGAPAAPAKVHRLAAPRGLAAADRVRKGEQAGRQPQRAARPAAADGSGRNRSAAHAQPAPAAHGTSPRQVPAAPAACRSRSAELPTHAQRQQQHHQQQPQPAPQQTNLRSASPAGARRHTIPAHATAAVIGSRRAEGPPRSYLQRRKGSAPSAQPDVRDRRAERPAPRGVGGSPSPSAAARLPLHRVSQPQPSDDGVPRIETERMVALNAAFELEKKLQDERLRRAGFNPTPRESIQAGEYSSSKAPAVAEGAAAAAAPAVAATPEPKGAVPVHEATEGPEPAAGAAPPATPLDHLLQFGMQVCPSVMTAALAETAFRQAGGVLPDAMYALKRLAREEQARLAREEPKSSPPRTLLQDAVSAPARANVRSHAQTRAGTQVPPPPKQSPGTRVPSAANGQRQVTDAARRSRTDTDAHASPHGAAQARQSPRPRRSDADAVDRQSEAAPAAAAAEDGAQRRFRQQPEVKPAPLGRRPSGGEVARRQPAAAEDPSRDNTKRRRAVPQSQAASPPRKAAADQARKPQTAGNAPTRARVAGPRQANPAAVPRRREEAAKRVAAGAAKLQDSPPVGAKVRSQSMAAFREEWLRRQATAEADRRREGCVLLPGERRDDAGGVSPPRPRRPSAGARRTPTDGHRDPGAIVAAARLAFPGEGSPGSPAGDREDEMDCSLGTSGRSLGHHSADCSSMGSLSADQVRALQVENERLRFMHATHTNEQEAARHREKRLVEEIEKLRRTLQRSGDIPAAAAEGAEPA
eukprot:TRINITY_DN2489_c0_g1_i2.p1 TRINITY_DN2489_c0_g1~~TRINITY_DN2489_c0_g1_i2.p1  ORF type:complete len:1078 (+),score=342.87 TRINITY_DN2489_c0_g1_i2:121-3354(+)